MLACIINVSIFQDNISMSTDIAKMLPIGTIRETWRKYQYNWNVTLGITPQYSLVYTPRTIFII